MSTIVDWTPRDPTLRCWRCGRQRHVLDLVAHFVGLTRCRNARHFRCREGCRRP